jgi:uncharacterized protein (TIGR02145 family)
MPTCPFCNKNVALDAVFCRECGKSLKDVVKCPKCGSALSKGAKFCNKCGATLPITCPQCGGALILGAKFCNKCGSSLPSTLWLDANICLKCNAPLKPGAKFCTKCGSACKQAEVENSQKFEKQVSENASVVNPSLKYPSQRLKENPKTPEVADTFAKEEPISVTEPVKTKEDVIPAPVTEEVKTEAPKEISTEEKNKTPVSADTFEKEETASLIESVKIKEESSEKSSGKDNKSKNLFLGIGVFFVFLVGGIISFILLWDSDPLNAYYQDEFEYQMIVDSRDGQKYRTIQVGSQNWMAQNLNYAANGSICDSCELYGRLYTYETAKNSCPTGYTLPTLADLKILKSAVGNANALFSKKGWENQGVDENGMAIIPGGFFSIQDGIIKRRGEMAGFWSITDYDEFAVRVKLDNYSSDISFGGLKKQYGFSVRCISEGTSINSKENDIVIDSRNEKILETITIGNQKWLASNMDVKLKKSYCPYDSDSYCESYGRLYEWSAAKNACPKGYRLPNAADFDQLSSSMEKETFNPLYAGFRNKDNTELFGVRANFWTASADGERAVYFYSKPEETTFLPSTFNKKAAMSVRCIEGVLEQDFNYSYITDERDNQVYKTVQIGNQEWMAENLNFALDGTYCYDNDEANCEKYGRLYVWTDAANLCPEGWHLPTDEEWIELKNYVSNNGNEKIGTNLRSIDHWKSGPGTDLFGLALVPSGCYLSTKDSFVRLGERAYIWSATEFDSDSVSHWAVMGDMEDLLRVTVYKKQARAVRCIRD